MKRAEDWLHAFYCMYIINIANNYWYFLGSRKIRTINSFIMEKNKNEELQSRRDFFKKAAKGVLPILGAVVLANAPQILNASEKTPMGCNYGCTAVCSTSACQGTCAGGCRFTCTHTCKNYGCKGVNKA